MKNKLLSVLLKKGFTLFLILAFSLMSIPGLAVGTWSIKNTTNPSNIPASIDQWQDVAMSADGSHLTAISHGGGGVYRIYESLDYGVTWNLIYHPNDRARDILSSSDGSHLAFILEDSNTGTTSVLTSADYGNTWVNRTLDSYPSLYVYSLAMNSSGSQLVASLYDDDLGDDGNVYISNDYGATWVDSLSTSDVTDVDYWRMITSSSDGTHLAVVSYHYDTVGDKDIFNVWASNNSGATWTNQTENNTSFHSIVDGSDGVAIDYSGDGTQLTLTTDGGVLTSVDNGVTWIAGDNSQFVNIGVRDIVSDNTGANLMLVADDTYNSGLFKIWVSHNHGATWTNYIGGSGNNKLINEPWIAGAISSDGSHLAAASMNQASVWTSADSGVTWTSRTSTDLSGLAWVSIASNSTGDKAVAVETGGYGGVYTTTNGGNDWILRATSTNQMNNQTFNKIISDNSGNNLTALALASEGEVNIWRSIDEGVTWVNKTSGSSTLENKPWIDIASDGSGDKLVALGGYGGANIYTSINGGDDWTDRSTGHSELQSTYWNNVASNDDGSKLIATRRYTDRGMFKSVDSGATWSQIDLSTQGLDSFEWYKVVSSDSGVKLAAIGRNTSYVDNLFTSDDSGVTWVNRTASLSLSNQNIEGLASDSTGNKLAFINDSDIWYSNDTGLTWTNLVAGTNFFNSNNWGSIDMNADGSKIFITSSEGIIIFEFTDNNTPTTPTTPPSTPTHSNGTIPLSFLITQYNQQRIIDQQHCTVTVNGVSTACSPQTIPAITPPTNGIASIFKFYRDLKLGMTGDDVKELQKYLNTHGYALTNSGAGSLNNETTYFGNLTKQAVIRYQTDHNIKPNVGYFGFITRSSFEQNN